MYFIDEKDRKYEYQIIKNIQTFGILSEVAHFITDIQDGNTLIIKDVWVKPELRKNGIWKSLLREISNIAKQENFKVIISLGQFRRPIASKVWSKIDNKVIIENPKSKKNDYYLYL